MNEKRKQELEAAATKAAAAYSSNDETRILLAMMFRAGARWADGHQHWRSVDKELPKCDKPWVNEKGEKSDLLESALCVVLSAFGDYTVATLNQNCDEESGKPVGEPYWYDEVGIVCITEVTHWMPLPVPPKKGGEK